MSVITGPLPSYAPPAAVVFVVFTMIAAWTRGKLLRRAGTLALTGHVVVAVFVLPRLPFRWDIGAFHDAALRLLAGNSVRWMNNVDAFVPFQAALYAVFGADPVVLAVVNGLLAVLSIVPLGYIARRLYVRSITAHGAQLVALFLPLSFILLTVPMRDAMGVFLLFVVLAALVRTHETGSVLPTVGAVPLTIWLATFREELAILLIFGAAAGFLVWVLDALTRKPVSLRTLGLGAVATGTAALLVKPSFVPLDRLSLLARTRAHGDASYLVGPGYQNITDLLLSAPGRALYFQFAPFPLHVGDPIDGLAATTTVVLLALAVAALRSVTELRLRRSVVAMVAVVYLLGIVGYGLGDSNFGTTVRHRIPFSFLLCLLAAPVLDQLLELLPRWVLDYLGARPIHSHYGCDQDDKTENLGDGAGMLEQ